jgi:hypothetical protein
VHTNTTVKAVTKTDTGPVVRAEHRGESVSHTAPIHR